MPNKVALVIADWPIYEKYCPSFVGMQDGLKALGIEYKVFSCRPRVFAQQIVDYEPDLVIYGLLDMVKDQVARETIRNGLPNAKIVMWYGDLRNETTGQIVADMSEIDMMFVSNNAQSKYYEKRWKVPACHFLPLGASIPYTVYEEKLDFDFVFIGAELVGQGFTDRAKLMGKFREHGLKIINADAKTDPEMRAKVLKMMPTVYRSSKVCLDISHFTDIDGYTSNRFWNIGAAGGVALTKRFPGCTDFYPENSRAYFDTFEEAIELKDKLIADPIMRNFIRVNAINVAKQHTYEHRFLEMFAKVYA